MLAGVFLTGSRGAIDPAGVTHASMRLAKETGLVATLQTSPACIEGFAAVFAAEFDMKSTFCPVPYT